MTVIETNRLVLREQVATDAAFVLALVNDHERLQSILRRVG